MSKLVPRQYLEETSKLRDTLESGFLVLGERLAKIRNEEMWRGTYDSFDEYTETLRLSKGIISKLISIHEKLVEGFKFPRETLIKLGWSGLYSIAQYAKTKQEAKELVEIGAGLRRGDLEDEILERKTGCKEHQFGEERVVLARCTKCGRTCRVK